MKFFLLLLLSVSCAQVTSLNMRKHQFGIVPTKVIWFQIAGFEEDHIGMLRFQQSGDRKTAFEETTCVGKAWNYNLYQLKPKAESSFMSQITGKKNIKLTCEDTQLKPVWSLIRNNGYQTGIIETGATPKQSLVNLAACGESGLLFLSNLNFWLRQAAPKEGNTYHFTEKIPLEPNKFFYDRSCSDKSCQTSLLENFRGIYREFSKVSGKHILIIRDFSYLRAIENKDFVRAREILADIEKTYGMAISFTQDNDYLVLLTTGDSKLLDMPDQGKAWFDFEKSGANVSMKRSKSTNLILASGSRAENFCGMYEEDEILERMLSGSKQQGLELKLINPFK